MFFLDWIIIIFLKFESTNCCVFVLFVDHYFQTVLKFISKYYNNLYQGFTSCSVCSLYWLTLQKTVPIELCWSCLGRQVEAHYWLPGWRPPTDRFCLRHSRSPQCFLQQQHPLGWCYHSHCCLVNSCLLRWRCVLLLICRDGWSCSLGGALGVARFFSTGGCLFWVARLVHSFIRCQVSWMCYRLGPYMLTKNSG